MLDLPKKLTKNRIYYAQVKRTARVAMYALRHEPAGTITGYEVFLSKIDKAKEAFGKMQPEKEHFPGNEEFGKIAWSWRTLGQAEKDYAGLCIANPSNLLQRACGLGV
jgi:hypothetical protein